MNEIEKLIVSSKLLQDIQDILITSIKEELNKPMIDHKKVKHFSKVLKKVDKSRRITWNKEKFDVYEEISKEIFSSDYIPF